MNFTKKKTTKKNKEKQQTSIGETIKHLLWEKYTKYPERRQPFRYAFYELDGRMKNKNLFAKHLQHLAKKAPFSNDSTRINDYT